MHTWTNMWLICSILGAYWPCIEDLCKAKAKPQCSNFQKTFLHLGRWTPRIRVQVRFDIWSDFGSGWPLVRCTPRQRHLVAKCDATLGQVDIWSELWVRVTFGQITQGRDILWPSVVLLRSGWHLVRSLGHLDIWSDILPLGRGILWPSVVLPQVRLTFGQIFRWGDIWSDILPRQRHLVAKYGTTSGLVDIWLDLWVTLTFGQTYPLGRDILWPSVVLPQVRLTFGQMFGSGWHLVRCTPRQRHLVAVDILSDVPPEQRHLVAKCDTTLGQVDSCIGGQVWC